MDFWNSIQDLPAFWTTDRGIAAGLNAGALVVLLVLCVVLARRGPENERLCHWDNVRWVMAIAAIASVLGWAFAFFVHSDTQEEYVRSTAVRYAFEHDDLVALSPVELRWPDGEVHFLRASAQDATSAKFKAVKTNGDVVGVIVEWLPTSTKTFLDDQTLPAGMDWVTVKITAEEK